MIDWAEVRLAYELGGETVRALRERFGLTPWQLRQRRQAEAWTARPPAAVPASLPVRRSSPPHSLPLRLNRMLAIGLAMLERRLADDGMTEANARALSELCRAQEVFMRSQRTDKGGKAREKNKNDGPNRARTYSAADIARKRAQLERRILAIRAAEGLSEAAEGGDG